tara:strand:+ start:74 stop:340 length:267 start_codon:yes stop_codon:yes gene_type:complete
MPLFSIICRFKSVQDIESYRGDHLNYIQRAHNLDYGGILNGKNKEILYIINCSNESEAANFVKKDPYFIIYQSYQIIPFSKKFPLSSS